jgi:purine-binding chemotaxis protein CheW
MSGEIATAAGSGGWDQIARAAAQRREAPAPAERVRQLLCVRVDSSIYAVGVENVREIVRVRPITPIPRVAAEVRGVISLRGEIIQVIDLRLRLGLTATVPARATRIVVVQAEDGRVAGVLVDGVREVLRAPESAIGPAAPGDTLGVVAALCANGSEFVSLVDLDRLLELDGHV